MSSPFHSTHTAGFLPSIKASCRALRSPGAFEVLSGRRVSAQSHLNGLASLGVPHSPVFIQAPKPQFVSAASHVAGPREAAAHAGLTKLQPKGFQGWHCRGRVAHIAVGFSAHWLPSSKAEAAHPRDFVHPAADELFPTLTRSDKPLPIAAMPSLRRELRIPGDPASWGSRPPSASSWLPSLTAVLPRGDGGRTLGTWSRWIPATALACVWWQDGWCSFYLW